MYEYTMQCLLVLVLFALVFFQKTKEKQRIINRYAAGIDTAKHEILTSLKQ